MYIVKSDNSEVNDLSITTCFSPSYANDYFELLNFFYLSWSIWKNLGFHW